MKFSGFTVSLGMALLGCQGSGSPPADPSRPSSDMESEVSRPAAEESAPEYPGDGSETTEQVWRRFVGAWNASDEGQMEPFRAQNGLIALDNPGAFVQMRLLQRVRDIQDLEGQYDLARLKSVRLNPKLDSGDAPARSCEDDVPMKGTFRAAADRVQLDARFRALGEYELAPPAEISRLELPIQAARAAARYAIYDLDANVGFLFGEEEGRIVLLAIDAVIPCSA